MTLMTGASPRTSDEELPISTTRPAFAPRPWHWMVLFALYALIGLSGYGTDPDTYYILRSGRDLLLDGVYRPSRYQGALVAETIIGAASLAGGHALANAVSALLGTLTLVLFHAMLREGMGGGTAAASTAIVAVNPWYAVASSSSMDYVYGLFFLVLGVWLIRRGTWGSAAGAGLSFALAVSARLSVAPIMAAIYLLWLFHAGPGRGRLRPVASGAVAAVATLLLYVPAWLSAGRTLGFLGYDIGAWGLAGSVARFAYKNVYLWGLPAALLLAAGVVRAWRRRRPSGTVDRRWLVAGGVLIAVQELLFARVPVEISYLLPVLLLAVPPWVAWVRSRGWAAALFALTLAYDVVSLDVLRVEYAGGARGRSHTEAVGGSVSPHLEAGVLLFDLGDRPAAQAYFQRLVPARGD